MEPQKSTTNLSSEMNDLLSQADAWARQASIRTTAGTPNADDTSVELNNCLGNLERAFIGHLNQALASRVDVPPSESRPPAAMPSFMEQLEDAIVINVAKALMERLGLRCDDNVSSDVADNDVLGASRNGRQSLLANIVPMTPIQSQESSQATIVPIVPQNHGRPSAATTSQPPTPLMVRANRNVATTSQPSTPLVARINRNVPTPRVNETPFENRASRLRREKLLHDRQAVSVSQPPSRRSSISRAFGSAANSRPNSRLS